MKMMPLIHPKDLGPRGKAFDRSIRQQKIIGFQWRLKRRFIIVGHRLYRIKIEKTYEKFGYRSFERWIRSHENIVGKRRMIYDLIRLYLIWENRLKSIFSLSDIHRVGYSKLIMVAGEIEQTEDPEKIKKIVNDAKHLHYTALRIRRKHNKPMKYK